MGETKSRIKGAANPLELPRLFCRAAKNKVCKLLTKEDAALLSRLDMERQQIIYPGVTRVQTEYLVKDVSANGKSAEIVYSHRSEETVDRCIQEQMESARQFGQTLEWKVYGHDRPACLGNRLTAAGFAADEKEAFMVFDTNESPVLLPRFGAPIGEIRRVTGAHGLRDYRTIREEIKGETCDEEIARYAFLLENYPSNLSIYVAYVDNEPAACGRVYFHPDSAFAGLYGGQTRPKWRKRGLFTQLVAARIQEAVERGVPYMCVDALSTSEPILQKRGFRALTFTQPFIYAG